MPKSYYSASIANFTLITHLFTILGPTIAGALFLFSELYYGLLVSSCLLILSFCFTIFLSDKTKGYTQNHSKFIDAFKEGWEEFKKLRYLKIITGFVVFTNATYGVFQSMLIYYLKSELRLNNANVAFLMTCLGLGGIIGSLLNKWIKRKPLGYTLGLSMLFCGLGYTIMATLKNYLLVGINLIFIGISSTIFTIGVHTFRQEVTPNHLIGRIVGITGSLFKLAMPFTIFSAGWMSENVGVDLIFLISGLVNVLLFCFFSQTKVWKLK